MREKYRTDGELRVGPAGDGSVRYAIRSNSVPSTGDSQPAANWEQRQKHAAFFQTMLGSVQQAAIAGNTSAAVVLTLGGVMAKFSGVLDQQDWNVLLVAVVGWGLLSMILVSGFSRSAVRIEATYREEHARLFPGATPYRLESFLLDFAGRFPRLAGNRAKSQSELQGGGVSAESRRAEQFS